MQAGFISIALGVKVVEGSVLQVDPLCVVAPRAKAVVVREHMRRKGAAAMRTLDDELERRDEAQRERERQVLAERAAATRRSCRTAASGSSVVLFVSVEADVGDSPAGLVRLSRRRRGGAAVSIFHAPRA